jgi:cytochrome c oxidase subunit 3
MPWELQESGEIEVGKACYSPNRRPHLSPGRGSPGLSVSNRTVVVEPYQAPAQQHEAAQLGMWVSLATEVMLFGGLFMGILVFRLGYEEVARAASGHLHLWIGGLNTAVLLTSSLTMALAVTAAREGRVSRTVWHLLGTAALGLTFLGIKGYEDLSEYAEGLMPGVGPPFPLEAGAAELFFNLYFAATGLHALHLICGIAAVLAFACAVGMRWLRLPARRTPVEGLGMYWHLVDIVWVFLYPVLYLV